MDIFSKDYADITPYQIQRFVHEITQDNANQRISLKYPSKFGWKCWVIIKWVQPTPKPMTHDIPNLAKYPKFTHHPVK